MILIITQQLKEKVMSVWAYRCAEGPSSNPCIPKMLESSSTSEELWWEHEKKTQNSPPPKVLSEGAACKTKTPVRAEWLQTFGDVLPTCAPMSHTLATSTAKPSPEQNVYKFSSPCLPISFVTLLPLKATLPFGTRIKGIKETRQEKQWSIFFSRTMGVFHLNGAGCILQLPWLWPGIPGCLARVSGILLPLEVHCNCCHNTTASTFGKNTNLLLRFQSPNTTHTPLRGLMKTERRLWKGNFQGSHGNRREHSWLWWFLAFYWVGQELHLLYQGWVVPKNCTVRAQRLIWDTCQKSLLDSWKTTSSLVINLLYPEILIEATKTLGRMVWFFSP